MWHCLSQITQHSSQIWPNLPDCFIRCFLSVNAKHQSKTLWYFGKWFASKARKLSLKVYDGRNTSMCHTVPLGFCSKCMLSLNMGLTGLSEITRLSEIWRLYPICEIFRFNHSFLVIFFTIWYSGWVKIHPQTPHPYPLQGEGMPIGHVKIVSSYSNIFVVVCVYQTVGFWWFASTKPGHRWVKWMVRLLCLYRSDPAVLHSQQGGRWLGTLNTSLNHLVDRIFLIRGQKTWYTLSCWFILWKGHILLNCQTSNISCIKFQKPNVPRLLLQLSFSNPLNPGRKWRIKM